MNRIELVLDIWALSLLKEILNDTNTMSIVVRRMGVDYPIAVKEIRVIKDE